MLVRKSITTLALLVCLVVLVATMGCSKKDATVQAAPPAVKPPAIIKAGKLTVGVALGSAPYAVEVEGGYAGFDVEVAEAIASKLNLEPEYVLVNPDMIESFLKDKSVDIVLSAPDGGKRYQVIGSYHMRSLARYGKVGAESANPKTPAFPVAVQLNSPAYWLLKQQYGDESYTSFDSIVQAIAAVESGKASEVIGDSVVLSYATNNGAKIAPIGIMGDESPLGIAVASDNTELASVMQSTFDAMQSAGVFDSLKRTWFEAPNPSPEENPAQ